MHGKTILYFIIGILSSDILKGQCEDFIIESLPYTHSYFTTGQGNDWSFNTWTDGNDVAYKLTLTSPRTIYVDTCDPDSDFDTILGVKNACGSASSILETDDATIEFCPPGASNISPSHYASLIDSLPLEAGTYYIIVDGYGGASGNYGIAIGALPEIDTSYIASDDSYIEVVFTDPIYTNSNGTGGAQISDLEIDFSQNGGNATNVAISTLTNNVGGGLVGGEDTIRINIVVTGLSSGVETVTIRPVNRYSIFNSYGIGLSRSSSVTANLNDYFPPSINFIPANDTIGSAENILLQFDQQIRLVDGNTDPTNDNIDALFTLAYADTGTNQIPFNASVDNSDTVFTLNPDNNLEERRTIAVSFAGSIFEDLGNNAIPANSASFIVRDVTPATIISDSLGQTNQYVFLSFDEGVYTNANGSGGLIASDFEISNFVPGNATNPSIQNMNSWVGTILSGGETEIRITLGFLNDPDGSESITIRPQVGEVFDDFGNQIDVGTNARTFELNDVFAPYVTIDPVSGNIINPNSIFTLTLSENVRLLNDEDVTNANIADQITVAYTDGSAESIPFGATILNYFITVDPDPSGPSYDLDESRQVRVSILDSLEDFADNQMDIFTADFTVQDITPPIINAEFCSIITSNAFIKLPFSEGVFTNDNGTGALDILDFNLEFDDNGGNASAATISDLQQPGPSGPLSGGEDSIWVYLNITGPPSGIETIIIE